MLRFNADGSVHDETPAFVPFSPAELGLDPDDYDLELWERGPRRRS